MSRTAVWACLLLLLAITVLPIARTVAESVLVRERPGGPATVSFERYRELFVGAPAPATTTPPTTTGTETPATRSVAARWRLLGNSVAIATVAALVAVLLGVPFALLVARTDAPLRGVLGALYGVPLVLPPLLTALAWTYLRRWEPDPSAPPPAPSAWDGPVAVARSGGMLGLAFFPLVVLFTVRALDRIPASLEESARLAGGPWRALRSVTLPLAAPAVLAAAFFAFLFALHDFSLVDFLNWVRPLPQQIGVYPFESFTAWSKSQGEGIATALGVPLAVLGIGLLVATHALLGRASRATVTGEFRAAPPIRLGRWRVPAAAAGIAVLVLAAGVPVAGLLSKAAEGKESYAKAWRLVAPPDSPANELLWSLGRSLAAACVAVPIAFVLAHHAARTRRMWPLALAALPLALPPVFLGAGYLRILNDPAFWWPVPGGGTRNPFLDADGPRLGSVLLLAAKYLPFAMAALWSAFLSIDPRLEEAAATAGAGRTERALGILAPLAFPAAALAFVLVFTFSLREIDTLVLLASDTVMHRIYSMVHFQRDSQVAALCVILLVLVALPFAFLALLAPQKRRRPAVS